MLGLMTTLWVPGASGPLEQFVERVQRQIADFAQRHGLEQVAVEVELAEGALFHVKEISPEPGFGFLTVRPYAEDGGDPEEELIVPLGSVRRIVLGKAEEKLARFGFTPPQL
jgi:hypothetical protein